MLQISTFIAVPPSSLSAARTSRPLRPGMLMSSTSTSQTASRSSARSSE